MNGPRVLSLFAGIGGFDLGLERAGFVPAWQIEIDPFCQRVLAARWPGVERAGDVRRSVQSTPFYDYERRVGGGVQAGSYSRLPDGESSPQRSAACIDLLVGGFPCQDLSVAGKRTGLEGARSSLFWEIVRIAKITRPTWGLFENVPGLISSHRGRDLWTVLQGLRECWPAVGYRVLDSRYFGVAQRRRRVFFVCGPTEAGVAEVLALTEGSAGDPEAGGQAGAESARSTRSGVDLVGTFGSNKERGGWRAGPDEAAAGHLIAGALQSHVKRHGHAMTTQQAAEEGHLISHALSAGEPKASAHQSMNPNPLAPSLGTTKEPAVYTVAETLSAGSNPNSNMAGRRREDDVNLVTGSLEEFQITCDCGHTFIGTLKTICPGCHQLRCGVTNEITHALTGEGHDASEDGTGRVTPLVVGETGQGFFQEGVQALRAEGENRPSRPSHLVHASAVRRLTPLECERLQSFPDGWTCLCQPLEAYAADPDAVALACTCPDSPRYRALGNAVTVNVITWLGQRLQEVMNEQVG